MICSKHQISANYAITHINAHFGDLFALKINYIRNSAPKCMKRKTFKRQNKRCESVVKQGSFLWGFICIMKNKTTSLTEILHNIANANRVIVCRNTNIREINSLFTGWCASDQLLAIFKSANVFVLAANHLFFAIYTSKHEMHARSTGGTFIFFNQKYVHLNSIQKKYSQQLHKWCWIWRLFVQRLFFRKISWWISCAQLDMRQHFR